MSRSTQVLSPRFPGLERLTQSASARRGAVFGASLLCVPALCAATAWPFLRAHLQAVAVLKILSGQPVPRLVKNTVAAPIQTHDIVFAVPSGTGLQRVRARVYLPDHKPNAPAVVIFHGVHHLGIDEPRLEAFATAIAHCGIRVLTPEHLAY